MVASRHVENLLAWQTQYSTFWRNDLVYVRQLLNLRTERRLTYDTSTHLGLLHKGIDVQIHSEQGKGVRDLR